MTLQVHGAAPMTRPTPGHQEVSPVPAQDSKRCNICGETKLLEDFARNKRLRAGRDGRCKACMAARTAAWTKGNAERVRAKDRRGYNPERKRAAYEKRLSDPAYRAELWERQAERRRREPDKARAREIAQRAVRSGRLTRPATCGECGADHPRIEGHHDDYSKPLEVRWLCSRCHRLVHSPFAAADHLTKGEENGQ